MLLKFAELQKESLVLLPSVKTHSDASTKVSCAASSLSHLVY